MFHALGWKFKLEMNCEPGEVSNESLSFTEHGKYFISIHVSIKTS